MLLTATDMQQAQEQFQRLQALGYRIRERQALGQLGMVLSRFQIPANLTPRQAEQQLRSEFPQWLSEADQRYVLQGTGSSAGDVKTWGSAASGLLNNPCAQADSHTDPATGQPLTIAMLDSAVADNLSPELSRLDATGVNPEADDHGTAVANLLLGHDGVPGLAPGFHLLAVNVFASDAQGERYSRTIWLVRGLDLVLAQQPVPLAVNLSLGGGPSEILARAVALASSRTLLVAASGNGGEKAPPPLPAAYPRVVAVTALDRNGKPHQQAQRGDYISLAAPGVDIWTRNRRGKGFYASGSSFATPFVTVLLAMWVVDQREKEPAAEPGYQRLESYLANAAQDLGAPGRDPVFGWGQLQAPACKKTE